MYTRSTTHIRQSIEPPTLDRIAVDPAHRVSHAAWADTRGKLVACGPVDTPQTGTSIVSSLALAIETPVVRSGWTRNADSVLLTRDASKAWKMLCQWRSVNEYEPRDWKGTVPKPINHLKTVEHLEPDERGVLAASIGMPFDAIVSKIRAACERRGRTGKTTGYAWSAHNTLDAVGILLHDLERL